MWLNGKAVYSVTEKTPCRVSAHHRISPTPRTRSLKIHLEQNFTSIIAQGLPCMLSELLSETAVKVLFSSDITASLTSRIDKKR